jgi:hypothetical protein
MFQMNIVEKLKTHILRLVTFFRKSFHLRDNVKQYCRAGQDPQVTIWHMHIVCWIPKATSAHSEYAVLIAFQWLREHALMLHLYIHCLFCLLYWET